MDSSNSFSFLSEGSDGHEHMQDKHCSRKIEY